MSPETAAAILDVDLAAPAEEIRAAFRRRSRLLHPDRFIDAHQAEIDSATQEFARLNDAYDVMLAWDSDESNRRSSEGEARGEATSDPHTQPNSTRHDTRPPRTSSFQSPTGPGTSARPHAPTPRKSGRVAVAVVLAAVAAVGIAGAVNLSALTGRAASQNDSAQTDAASSDEAVDPSTESEEPASAPAESTATQESEEASPDVEDAVMPAKYEAAGYYDAGGGLAWKWDSRPKCESPAAVGASISGPPITCWTMSVMQYQQCDGSVQGSIHIQDKAGKTLETIDGEPLVEGAVPLVLEFDTLNSSAEQAQMHSLTCL